jgi:hypothetical protein
LTIGVVSEAELSVPPASDFFSRRPSAFFSVDFGKRKEKGERLYKFMKRLHLVYRQHRATRWL